MCYSLHWLLAPPHFPCAPPRVSNSPVYLSPILSCAHCKFFSCVMSASGICLLVGFPSALLCSVVFVISVLCSSFSVFWEFFLSPFPFCSLVLCFSGLLFFNVFFVLLDSLVWPVSVFSPALILDLPLIWRTCVWPVSELWLQTCLPLLK